MALLYAWDMKKVINAIGPIAFTFWFVCCLGLIVFGFFSIGNRHADTRALISVTEASRAESTSLTMPSVPPDMNDLIVPGTRFSYSPDHNEQVTVGDAQAITHHGAKMVVKLENGFLYPVGVYPLFAGRNDGDPCEVHVSMDHTGHITSVNSAFCGSRYKVAIKAGATAVENR